MLKKSFPFIYFILFFLCASYFATILWISHEFHDPYFEYIIFNIESEKTDLDNFSSKILSNYLTYCILFPLFCTIIYIYLEQTIKYFLDTKVRNAQMRFIYNKLIFKKLPIYLVIFASIFAFLKFGIFDYIKISHNNKADYIQENYQDPKIVKITPDRNLKNLILIYVEGLNWSYGDKSIFQKDLLKELKQHEKLKFREYIQTPGAKITMSALVATQCGLPLKIVSFLADEYQNYHLENFLPGAKCLGQTLKDFGYNNIFLGGAKLSFAHKGDFLKAHGYDETYGFDYWLSLKNYHESDLKDWGLNDHNLFREARKKLDNLIAKKELFNLTILTLDTHGPNFPEKNCKKNASLHDSVQCSTREVAKFIEYVKDKGYLENTNIVIIGDHIGYPIKNTENKKIYNSWISKNTMPKNRETIIAFDIAPSILEFIGLRINEKKYGLGYSAFFNKPKNFDENRMNNMKQNILGRSKFYLDHLWTK